MDRSAVAGLPDDILVQILSRVSVKDLYRSKCVSKSWCGLVDNPLYRKELPQTLHGFFYDGWGSHGDAGNDVEDEDRDGDEDGEEDADNSAIDTEDNDGGKDGVEDADDSDIDTEDDVDGEDDEEDDEVKNRIPLGYGHFINVLGRSAHLVDPTFSFVPGIDKLRFLDSCNGLLLFERAFDLDDMGFIVCNPATEQWAAVPGSQDWPPTDWHYYQASVHAYHSKTGAWSHSDIDWTEEERERSHLDLDYLQTSNAAFLNGMFYLISDGNKIFQVDFEGKTRGVIPAPSSIVQWNPNYTAIFVGQSQGRLHCVNEEWGADDFPSELSSRVHIGDTDDYPLLLLSIWVLDDNGTQKWVLKHSVSLFHLFEGKLGESDHQYKVVAIHPDRNLVFIVRCWNWQLISYNMDSKEVCALGTLGLERTRVTPFVPCFLDLLSN